MKPGEDGQKNMFDEVGARDEKAAHHKQSKNKVNSRNAKNVGFVEQRQSNNKGNSSRTKNCEIGATEMK